MKVWFLRRLTEIAPLITLVFLVAVFASASTSFATPVASPVNTLVLNPGQYRFGDFAKVGLALQALVLVATLLLVPLFFPW